MHMAMAMEVDRARPLLVRRLAVGAAEEGRGQRTADLVLAVLQGARGAGAAREKILRIELTDEADLFFLFTLDISAEDYINLKQDQNLLVEFEEFPTEFIKLVESCCEERAGRTYFMAKLLTAASTGVFSITEANGFKEVTHLSLRMRQGTDASLKHYLASRLCHSLTINRQQTADIETLRRRLEEERESQDNLQRNLEETRATRAKDLHEWQKQATSRESDLMEKMESLRIEHEKEIREFRSGADSEVSRVREQYRISEEQRTRLTEEGIHLQAQLSELQRKLDSRATEASSSSRENETLKARNQALEGERSHLERHGRDLERERDSLQQQVREMNQAVTTAEQLRRAAEEAHKQATESSNTWKSGVQNLRAQLEESANEIHKGNHIIQSLREEQRGLREKFKLKNQVIAKQEKILEAERKRAADLESRTQQLEHELRSSAHEQTRLADELASAQAKLQESRQLLETNQQVITWLHNEINQLQQRAVTTPARTTPFSGDTMPKYGATNALSHKVGQWDLPESDAGLDFTTPVGRYTSMGRGDDRFGAMTTETHQFP